jgi:hypothetical protein
MSISEMNDHMSTTLNGLNKLTIDKVREHPTQELTIGLYMDILSSTMKQTSNALHNRTLPWKASFLFNMIQNDSGSTYVLESFMILRDMWSLSKTSHINGRALKHVIQKRIITTMKKGSPMFYYFKSGWALAYVACVIMPTNEYNQYAYHMTQVGTTITETLFDHNVADYTGTELFAPSHTPTPTYTYYGNPGSLTALSPHDLCSDGYHLVCYDAPDEFKSTAPITCCMPSGTSTAYITAHHIGTVINLSSMLMIPQHANAISKIMTTRSNYPINFEYGYSDSALAAIANYVEVHSFNVAWWDINNISMNNKNHFLSTDMNSALCFLHQSMPFVPRPITYINEMETKNSYEEPPDAWTPGSANPRSFHYLDDRSGNWNEYPIARPIADDDVNNIHHRRWDSYSSDDDINDNRDRHYY